MGDKLWMLENKVRSLLGKSLLPRRCCRVASNLVPFAERRDLIVNKCKVCGSRHFELTIDQILYSIKGE